MWSRQISLFSRALLLVALGAGSVGRTGAQGLPVQPGEQPLDAYRYKASHNTYERNENNARQIDEYNCWAVEFDINWDGSDAGLFDRGIWVAHSCPIAGETRSMRSELVETLQADTIRSRATILWLEMKDNSVCSDFGSWPANYHELVFDRVSSALQDVGMDWDNVYTPFDFFLTDNQRWPSYQELVRRGKFLIFVLEDENGGFSSLFFNATDSPGNWNGNYNVAFVNREQGSFPSDTSVRPSHIDRWMWRSYPDGVTGDDSWDTAMDRSFNLVSTNKIDHTYTNESRAYPSAPLFVNGTFGGTEWGTLLRPFNTVLEAFNRAYPAADLRLWPGTYTESLILNKSMILRPAVSGFSVIIEAP